MKYYIDSDDDGHYYVIPEDREVAWAKWVYENDGSYVLPEWATSIDGHPNRVKFTIWELD